MARRRSCTCGVCRKCKDRIRKKRQYDAMTPSERRAWAARKDPFAQYAARRRARRKNNERYPEKEEARRIVRAAILSGRIKKQPCAHCGHPDTEAHHDDYSKPLDVTWLCPMHHSQAHKDRALGA